MFFFVEDGRIRPKHVEACYKIVYFCIELLCSFWNKRCRIIRL